MLHFGVNWIAVIVAMVASNALGVAWYMGLSKQWVAAQGKSAEEIKAATGGSVTPYIWSAASQLVMAYFLAVLTASVFGATTISNAVLIGIVAWVGFIATSMILNHRYQGQKWALTLIDGGYLLGVMLVQGVVIGLFG
jgi:hypothetical protein